MASKILIALFLVATNCMAGTINADYWATSQGERMYQTQSASGDNTDSDEERKSGTGTPTDLILDAEPEC